METVKDVISVLNQLLYAEVLDEVLLERSVNQFTELCELKTIKNDGLPIGTDSKSRSGIVLMDFDLYSEEKKEQARLLKLKKIKQQEFEYACNMRKLEKECRIYLEFKKHYGIEKSTFVLLQGVLIYAWFGNARNDKLIREHLFRQEGFKSLKIEV